MCDCQTVIVRALVIMRVLLCPFSCLCGNRKGKKRKVYGYGKGKKPKPAAKKKQPPRATKAVSEAAQQPEGAVEEGEEEGRGEEGRDSDREGGGAREGGEEVEGEEGGEEGGSGKKSKAKGGLSPWGDEDFYRRKSSRTAVVEKAIEREAILAHKARLGVKVREMALFA